MLGLLVALGLGAGGAAGVTSGVGATRWTRRVLVAGIAVGLALMATQAPAIYLADPSPSAHPVLLAGLALAAVALGLSLSRAPWAGRAWFPVALLAYAVVGVWLIHASPDPHVDVLTVHREAVAALREGRSPYGITFQNIYADGRFYPEGMTAGGRVLFGLPYPPLSLLLAAPGQLLAGDIRYAEMAAMLGAAVLMATASGAETAKLAAMALLFTPRSLFVLEQGWTEPFALLCLALVVASARRWPRGLPVALGLLLAVKQYLVLAALLTPWLAPEEDRRRGSLRLLAGAVGVAAAVTLPFFLWDARGFWRSVVSLQLMEPLRVDSLGILTGLASPFPLLGSAAVVAGVALAALAVGYGVSVARVARTPAGFAAGLGLVLFLLFLFGKKAFCNYYFFVLGAWCCTLAASPDPNDRPTPHTADPPSRPGVVRTRRH